MARRGRPSKNGDDDQTDLHIMMQLRKVVNLQGNHVVYFRNGDQQQIPSRWAQVLLDAYDAFPRPCDKFNFQDKISLSSQNLSEAVTAYS